MGRVAANLRRWIHEPGDLSLAVRIGWFMWRAPHRLARSGLPELLDDIRAAPRPAAADVHAAARRIARLRQPWFRMPGLRAHDTCYVRALTLYRFLDPGDRELRIHFVVEPGGGLPGRPKGHAWVTIDGHMLEERRELAWTGRTSNLYTHPVSNRGPQPV